MLTKFRFYLKMGHLAAHILRGFLICICIFPWLKKDAKKNHVQRWSQQLLAVLNVRVNMNLTNLLSGSVIISNHISWLDIFVINSVAPSRFVAKADIRSWPLLGWLSNQGGTIYLSRGKKADVKRIYHYLIEQIEAGERVVFFPEGTTAAQGNILPFHANLFEAAVQAKVPVQPLALRYLNAEGQFHQAVEFAGDTTVVTSLFNVLSDNDIIVELHGLEFISSAGVHRRELASASRQAVITALSE